MTDVELDVDEISPYSETFLTSSKSQPGESSGGPSGTASGSNSTKNESQTSFQMQPLRESHKQGAIPNNWEFAK